MKFDFMLGTTTYQLYLFHLCRAAGLICLVRFTQASSCVIHLLVPERKNWYWGFGSSPATGRHIALGPLFLFAWSRQDEEESDDDEEPEVKVLSLHDSLTEFRKSLECARVGCDDCERYVREVMVQMSDT